MKQIKIAKAAVMTAICLCVAIVGMAVAMFATLWNEGWMIRSMDKSGYFEDAAKHTRAECGLVISQAGVLGNIADAFLPDEAVREDIILATDAMFRNLTPNQTQRFSVLAETIENIIHEETGRNLGETQKQDILAVQFQTEQQYNQNTRPPFQAAIAVLMQYKAIAGFLCILCAIVILGGVAVLFMMSKNKTEWIKTTATSAAGAGVALVLVAAVTGLCGYQNWMPATNLEYPLFVEWFGGMWLGFLLVGIAITALSVWAYFGLSIQKRRG